MRGCTALTLLTGLLLGGSLRAQERPLLVERPIQQERTIAAGQSATGELSTADPVTRSRRAPYHVWTLEGRRGQRIVIDLMASEFDPVLAVRDDAGYAVGTDDDGGEGNNARLRTVLPRDGRYRLIVTAFSENSSGRYTMAVTGWDAPNAAAAGQAAAIAPGQSANGILEPGDEMAGDGPFQDRWTLDARAGQRLRAELRSSDFDAYLVLLGPDGRQIAADDDGAGNNDASLGWRAAAAGRYTLLASSYRDEPQAGAYRLTVMEEAGDFADPGVAATIAGGETRQGRLETGDLVGTRGLEDRWTFQGRAGQLVRLDVTSQVFDAYTVLRFGTTPVDSNDDGGEGNNSRLMAILPQTGAYTVVVSAFSGGASGGRYDVSLGFSQPPAGAGRVERLQPGRAASGRLELGDRPRSGGGYQDLWEFDGRQGQAVVVEMRSAEFDAFLELRDPDNALVAENDDGGEGTDALITATLPRAGRYRVVARSYGEREASGFYELSLALAGDMARPGRAVELREDQTVFGRLEAGDSLLGDSTYADVFTFRAPRDGEIAIDLRSSEFDAYLVVKDAEGVTQSTDDDGGDGTDARVTMRVDRGRTYRILANSYGQDRATGAYRVSVRYATP
jgi:hypothetical protein